MTSSRSVRAQARPLASARRDSVPSALAVNTPTSTRGFALDPRSPYTRITEPTGTSCTPPVAMNSPSNAHPELLDSSTLSITFAQFLWRSSPINGTEIATTGRSFMGPLYRGNVDAMKNVRWGIMGAGRIASALVEAVRQVPGGEVVTIGSSSRERAEAFADLHDIPGRHATHEDVARDPNVDIVYVATTNDLHHANTLAALERSKPVLCEKPFALNHRQAKEMVAAARERNVFLMEAMWMRFQPAISRLEAIVRSGRLGEIHSIQANFGFLAGPHPSGRLFDRSLGGGTVMDLGVYVVTFATMLLGAPDRIIATAEMSDEGIDEQAGIVLHHRNGGLSTLSTSFVADSNMEAFVSGSDGHVRVHAPFHHSPTLSIERRGTVVETIDTSYQGSPYRFEVEEVHRCLLKGATESPRMSLDDTLMVMRTLDRIRDRIGLTFPGE
ncbi:MAG TPA: Gfo/Idh/MocA family oxidoreductase [Actinobacteria bacterium]|nr:Gfo/Idh/MocA family oxidoreductase [Actinomycetota bacterium]